MFMLPVYGILLRQPEQANTNLGTKKLAEVRGGAQL